MNSIEKLINLELSLHGTKGFIDGLSSNFLIKKCNDGSENGYNLNTLIAKVPFKQGSIVFVGNDKYIVLDIEEQFAKNIYYRGTMRKCENFKLSTDTNYVERKNVVGFVDKDKSTLISNDYFLEENTYINATIPLQQFNINDEYVLYKGKAYMIVNVDDTKDGIVTLNSKYKDRYSEVEKVYSISLNDTSGILQVGQTLQLVVICKENDVVVNNPVVTYLSSDSNVATIDNKGMIICHKIGSITITCTYEGVSATYSLKVKQEDVYTIECDNVSINNGETFQLIPIVKINGEIIDNPTITYVVEDSSICTCSNGLVTGIGVGSTNITLSYEDNVSYKINVIIKEIEINYSIVGVDSFNRQDEEKFTIEPKINCIWYIDDFQSQYIASIVHEEINSCIVYGKNNTTSNYFILYAKDDQGRVLAEKKINVINKNSTYSLDVDTTISFNVDEDMKTYKITPISKRNSVVDENSIITYTSNDTNIATVDVDGLVTCVSSTSGSTTILVKYMNYNGDTKASKTINVNVIKTVENDGLAKFHLETDSYTNFNKGDTIEFTLYKNELDENGNKQYYLPKDNSNLSFKFDKGVSQYYGTPSYDFSKGDRVVISVIVLSLPTSNSWFRFGITNSDSGYSKTSYFYLKPKITPNTTSLIVNGGSSSTSPKIINVNVGDTFTIKANGVESGAYWNRWYAKGEDIITDNYDDTYISSSKNTTITYNANKVGQAIIYYQNNDSTNYVIVNII